MTDAITVVSGLPRSGTSMMMKMLEAGGVLPLTDHARRADADNPKGYYEWERVKQLPKGDTDWVEEARGKSVKVISALLKYLPPTYEYRLIFLHRDIAEILASQREMLLRRGEAAESGDDDKLAGQFKMHVHEVTGWLADQSNFALLHVNYNAIIAHPKKEVEKLGAFLRRPLDEDAMVRVVDSRLYRQRRV